MEGKIRKLESFFYPLAQTLIVSVTVGKKVEFSHFPGGQNACAILPQLSAQYHASKTDASESGTAPGYTYACMHYIVTLPQRTSSRSLGTQPVAGQLPSSTAPSRQHSMRDGVLKGLRIGSTAELKTSSFTSGMHSTSRSPKSPLTRSETP